MSKKPMKIERVEWKPGFPHRGIDPTQAREEIEAIRASKAGRFSAVDVVEAAKSKDHLFHPYFEWDDTVAGQHWRLQQSRTLTTSLVVVYQKMPERTYRAYEIVQQAPRRDTKEVSLYSTSEEALADPDTYERLVKRAHVELNQWRSRTANLKEFHRVHIAIDELPDLVGAEN